jgi:site-specific DNA recombinase
MDELLALSAVPVPCAIYSHKSIDEGLDQDFNSLDAQREAEEAYIRSQAKVGWTCLLQRYDEGGYSSRTHNWPALQRLLADTQAGQIDCALTHRVDWLSRSLFNLAKLTQQFEQHRWPL